MSADPKYKNGTTDEYWDQRMRMHLEKAERVEFLSWCITCVVAAVGLLVLIVYLFGR